MAEHALHWVFNDIANVIACSTMKFLPLGISAIDKYGFNLALHVGDCPQKVNSNRDTLKRFFPENNQQQWLEQVHGSRVVVAKRNLRSQNSCFQLPDITADGVYTNESNLTLAVMTADCLPVLLTTKQGDEIAAVHCGWRSLVSGILANALEHFRTNRDDVYAWLGPCIGVNSFEVGEEVKEAFIQQSTIFEPAFIPHLKNKDKYLADLVLIAKLQLAELGVQHISGQFDCTYQQAERYFSYRREQQTGRMASLICLRE